MKNKWIKRGVMAGLGVLLTILGLHVGLHVLSSRPWVHQKISEKLAQATGREVRLGNALLNLRGVSVDDFALSKPGGFEEGVLFHIKQAQVRVSLWHLLYGHFKIKAVEVNGLLLHVVRDEEGKLNVDFSDSSSPAPAPADSEKSSGAPLSLSIDVLSAREMEVFYEDKQARRHVLLQDMSVTVRNFAWNKPFEVQAQTKITYGQEDKKLQMPLGLSAKVNLAGLDLPRAEVENFSLVLRPGTAQLRAEGRVHDLENPQFDFALHGKNFSSAALADFMPQAYPVEIKQISARAQGVFSAAEQQVRLTDGALLLPGLEVVVGGLMRPARGEYEGSSRLQAQLDRLAESLPFLASYKLAGNFTASAEVTHKNLSARAELADGGAVFARAGKFSNVHAALDATGKTDGKNGQGVLGITGELNGEKFQTDLSFTQTAHELVADIKAAANRLILPPAPPEEKAAPAKTAAADPAQQNSLPAEEKSAWSLPPLTAKADVKIGSLDAPYLNGKDFNFQVEMSGITPKLDDAHGTLVLSVSDGKITDLYKLTDSNAVMKVLFLSLNVVGKVFNSLDVLSVLGGLAGSFDKSAEEEVIKMIPDENGEMVPVKVSAHARKMDGVLAYDKFVTNVQFNDGVATVKEGSFVSGMMSFNLSGTTDFKTEKIDMTVHAAPGKHETNGVMPLTLKIGGTVSEPSGSMSVVGSVASLVTQGVTNNFASRTVKKTVGGVVGLFKKKENPAPQETVVP